VHFLLRLSCHPYSEINSEVAVESNDGFTFPRTIQSFKEMAKAVQSHSDSIATDRDVELALQVHVEQTCSIEYDTLDCGRANRRGPSSVGTGKLSVDY